LDDGQPGWSDVGSGWFQVSWFYAAYNHECHLAPAGSGTDSATWEVTGLTPGTYTIQASWVGYHNNGTSAPYRIYDGNTLLATVRVDQTVTASGDLVDGTPFQTLAGINITSGTLRVVLGSDGTNGYYIEADAVRVVPGATSVATGPAVAAPGGLQAASVVLGPAPGSSATPAGSTGNGTVSGTAPSRTVGVTPLATEPVARQGATPGAPVDATAYQRLTHVPASRQTVQAVPDNDVGGLFVEVEGILVMPA
jgi:hypothetical protein